MAANTKIFAEFFAGIGLVHEGLRLGGWQCVYANDIDPKKHAMYAAQFPGSDYYHVEDIWETEALIEKLHTPPVLATASFPCTDLSLAGHWEGIDGKHSSSYFGLIEVLKALGRDCPKLVMLENVCGFITSRGGDDFARAIMELANLGYWIDAIVVDAKHFVPQSRPRAFVIALHQSVKNAPITRQSKRLGLTDPWRMEVAARADLRPVQLRKLMEEIDLPTGWFASQLPRLPQKEYHLNDAIDFDPDQDWWPQDAVQKHYAMMESPSKLRVDQALQAGQLSAGTAFRRTRRGKTRLEVRFDIAGCLRTPKGGSAKQIVVVIDGDELKMRWMSAREYARLQGACDFNITVPTTQAMFGFGDAVCVPVIEWIDKHLLTPLYQSIDAPSSTKKALSTISG